VRPRTDHHDLPAEWNAVTERVIACAIEVHSLIGPGLLESAYEVAMERELALASLRASRQARFRTTDKGVELPELRLDLVVEDLVAVELKSVELILDAHLAQLVSQIRFAHLPLGLLINFNVPRLVVGLHRPTS
jgi:GxxExxY protein